MTAKKWVEAVVAALGRVPQTPEEALRTLGLLLRADPVVKEEFIKEAHAAWVRGGWEVVGDNTPEALVVLAALEEATRRLAERHKWKKGGERRDTVRVIKGQNLWESRIEIMVAPRAPRGKGVFWVEGKTLNQKVLWRAAYEVADGKEITLAAPSRKLAEKAAQMVALRAAKLAVRSGKEQEGSATITMPWGDKVRVLPGDRWEDLSRQEPRIAEALRGLREILEYEHEEDEDVEDSWVHQTRVPVWAIRALLEAQGEELEGVETAYLYDLQEEVLSEFHEEMDVYSEAEWRKRGIVPFPRKNRETWFHRVARFSAPTYEEVLLRWREFRGTRGKKSFFNWGKMFPLLAPLAALEALERKSRDPEQAAMDALHHALKVAARLRLREEWAEVNPLLYLSAEIRHYLQEERERLHFSFSQEDKAILKRYFAALSRGVPEEEARKLLPKALREVLETEFVSAEALLEKGVDPAPQEPDYDTLLLKGKVRELLEDVEALWGPQGVSFVEALMDGAQTPGAIVRSGLPQARAEEILAYLRQELEGWAE